MKNVALLLSGNLRTFLINNEYIARKYVDFVQSHGIDVFIYTDDNDFNYQGTQYFSDRNEEKIMGIPSHYDRRYHISTGHVTHAEAVSMIRPALYEMFGNHLKRCHIDMFHNDITKLYIRDNIYHCKFMTNPYSSDKRKFALLSQFYKLYKCHELLEEYEKNQHIVYDVIIKSRFDGTLNGLSDVRSFDLSSKIYCEGYPLFINDWWAIGNRSIMEKYCNYYNTISPNILNGVYAYRSTGDWVMVVNTTSDPRNQSIVEDATDSGEVGLTYLLRTLENYTTYYNHGIRIDLSYKFYN